MVIAEQKVWVAVFHLPHVAEFVVAVVEAELLTETEEVAFLDADTPVQVVVAPFAARKSETHGYG